MAIRAFWRGYLKLSLVTCPVAMLSATSEAEKVRFHTLNRRTGNRVEMRVLALGPTEGTMVVVEKGVAEGDTVIVGQLQKIGPGMPVQPLPKTNQPAS